MNQIPIQMLKDEFALANLTPEIDLTATFLRTPEINRPAFPLTGFYDVFTPDRLQLVGHIESVYLEKQDPEERLEKLHKLFSHKISCVVVCHDIVLPPEFVDIAKSHGTVVLRTPERTSDFLAEVSKWLRVQLAPRMTIHGVLVDVYGEGILITGESGIGKSEAALELIKRGHRLVADDAVILLKVSNTTLVGTCPEITRYMVELRGVGIVDIRQMFGVSSIKLTQQVDMVIKLEAWDERKIYERLSTDEETVEYMGVNIVCSTIPVRPGRNMAIICESAAISRRLKKIGFDANEELIARVDKSFGKM